MKRLKKNEMKGIVGGDSHPCDLNPKCSCIVILLDAGASVEEAFDWCEQLYG